MTNWAGWLMLSEAVGCGGSAPPATEPRPADPPPAPLTLEAQGGHCRQVLGADFRGWTGAAATAPAPLPEPIALAPKDLEGTRVAGEKYIRPDERTLERISRTHERTVRAGFKLCFAADGSETRVSTIETSCFQTYDEKLVTALRGWRYAPHIVDGVAVPFCTAITFVYRQQ